MQQSRVFATAIELSAARSTVASLAVHSVAAIKLRERRRRPPANDGSDRFLVAAPDRDDTPIDMATAMVSREKMA
jgi:hypothetical protein